MVTEVFNNTQEVWIKILDQDQREKREKEREREIEREGFLSKLLLSERLQGLEREN